MIRPDTVLLFLWFGWGVVACLLSARAGIASLRQNIPYFGDMFVSMLVLYPLGLFWGKKRDFRLLSVLIDLGAAIFTLLSVLALLSMVQKREPYVLLGHSFGLNDVQRLAVGANPNTAGAFSAFFLPALLYRFKSSRSPWWKAFCCFSGAVCLVTLYFTNCRTSYIAAVVTAAAWVFAVLYRRTKSRKLHALLILCALLISAAVCGLAYYLIVRLGLWTEGVRGGSILTLGSRIQIWKATITELKSNRPLSLRGCSLASTISYLRDLKIYKKTIYTHNQFLEIWLGQGAPALVLCVIWLIAVIRKSIPVLVSDSLRSAWILPLMLLNLFIGNLAEAMLLGLHHYTGSMFFLIAGYTVSMYEISADKRRGKS